MPLPSAHAPKGIKSEYLNRTVQYGKNREKPVEYTFRRIGDKVHEAQKVEPSNDGDIEMVSFDDSAEVEAISSYVQDSRSAGQLHYDTDPMDLDPQYHTQREIIVISGNTSFLIVDTNFMLSQLNILEGLRKLAPEYGLKIVIPIAVFQELDGLKTSNKSDGRSASVGQLARWANDWIYNCLAQRDPSVLGQKKDERLDTFAIKDDGILDCCLYFREKNPKTLQVLLSNDKNLCMKALANEVLTVSHRSGMTAQQIASMIAKENVHLYGIIGKETIVKEKQVRAPQDYSHLDTYQTIYREVEMLTLSVVHHCMDTSYGEDLDVLPGYDRDSVSSLRDACKVMGRFWTTVFSDYLGKQRDICQKLQSLEFAGPVSKDLVDKFVSFWSALLTQLYIKEMDAEQNNALKILIQRWKDMAAAS